METDKKIHVEIKPISNGNAPMSASVDELRATIEGMSLSPASYPSVSSAVDFYLQIIPANFQFIWFFFSFSCIISFV